MRNFFAGPGVYIMSDLVPATGFDVLSRPMPKRTASSEKRAARTAQKRARAITRHARKRGK
jgi:hypothetical protein